MYVCMYVCMCLQTNPKTLGVAVLCPVDLDDETGPFLHARSMEQGYFCRPIADYPTELEASPTPVAYLH